jgi:hypothetical protein
LYSNNNNFIFGVGLLLVDRYNVVKQKKQKYFRQLYKILKETIGNVSSVTQIPLEMNSITSYNVDTLSKTVRTSSQVTLEIGQMFLNLKIL